MRNPETFHRCHALPGLLWNSASFGFASFPFIRVKRKSCFYIFLRETVPAFLAENIVFFGICTYLWEALPLFTARPMNTWQIKLSNFDISGSQVAQCQFKWHNGAAEICVYFVVKQIHWPFAPTSKGRELQRTAACKSSDERGGRLVTRGGS